MIKQKCKKIISCRICKNKNLQKVISLGTSPLANSFLSENQINEPESFYPLELYFCDKCGLLQLGHIVSPDLLFKDYVYVSSTSPVFVKHFEDYAENVHNRFNFKKGSLVIDIGSNDGVLLKPFKKLDYKILGIDPATEIAKKASKEGIETLPEYFNQDLAKKIAKKYGKANVICANNVFAHIDDIDEIVKAVKIILKNDGVFVIEAAYLVNFIEQNLFDTVYHEHLSYYLIKPLVHFFELHGMQVFDVEIVNSHGGSLRVFVKRKSSKYKVSPQLNKLLSYEEKNDFYKLSKYIDFGKNIRRNKTKLTKMLNRLKNKGKTIIGFGAPAKGNTLLNYFGIGNDILDFIVDDNPLKQGLYSPGTHIPIVSSEKIKITNPDYILILAWNFAESIMQKLSDYNINGGKFIVPVPEPKIVKNTQNISTAIVEKDILNIVSRINSDIEKLEGKTLLISGGSGFLGSYFIKVISYLNKNVLKKPCKVLSIDNYITGSKENNFLGEFEDHNIEHIYHDVRLPLFLKDNIDYVIHAAGLASPYYYQKYPLETIESAVVGVKNLLELARTKKSKSFLFFSSSEIYGNPDPKFVPIPESYHGNVSSIGPRSCYDESKRLGETISTIYFQQFEVPVKIVRPFNIYGPGMKPNDYRVMPTFIYNGLNGKNLPVHGSGEQTRTFCYVADAIVAFLKVLLNGKDGEIYNVGNDKPEVTMFDLAEIISNTLKNNVKPIKIEYPDSYPAGEPQRRCPDITKIFKEFGFKPEFDLKEGIERTILWYKSKYNL